MARQSCSGGRGTPCACRPTRCGTAAAPSMPRAQRRVEPAARQHARGAYAVVHLVGRQQLAADAEPVQRLHAALAGAELSALGVVRQQVLGEDPATLPALVDPSRVPAQRDAAVLDEVDDAHLVADLLGEPDTPCCRRCRDPRPSRTAARYSCGTLVSRPSRSACASSLP